MSGTSVQNAVESGIFLLGVDDFQHATQYHIIHFDPQTMQETPVGALPYHRVSWLASIQSELN